MNEEEKELEEILNELPEDQRLMVNKVINSFKQAIQTNVIDKMEQLISIVEEQKEEKKE